jgi:hypothetical protein
MNGNPFPEPFVFPLATSPDWEMNKIVTYEITLGSDGVAIETGVNDWSKTNNVDIIYDKQWWLSVDKDELEFKLEGDSETFIAETNYSPGLQFPAGLQITGTEIEYSSGVGVTGVTAVNNWITLGLSNSPNSPSQIVTVTASKNEKSVERKAKIKVKAGNITKIINVTQEPGLPVIHPDSVESKPLVPSYVGAFWKKNQTGERVITIPVTSANAGYWSVQVYYYFNDFKQGDIQFSTTPSEDPNFGTDSPADMNSKDASYRVLYGKEYATGKVADNGGNIFFRIGLESPWSGTTNNPARYAVVVIGYKNNNRFQALYLRQGEDPDYLIYPGDDKYKYRTTAYTKKFVPYNLTAPGMSDSDHTDVGKNQGVFVDYPSKAGALFKWTGGKGQERWAWHPTKPTISSYDDTLTDGAWNKDNETCPSGYRRPKAAKLSAETTSEFAMSLLFDPTTNNNVKNSVWGYYADGFFDRRPVGTSNTGYRNTVVNNNSHNVAYIGRLFYNNITGSSRRGASIFFPAPGGRDFNAGKLEFAGYYGFYVSASPVPSTSEKVYDFQVAEDDIKYAHSGFNRYRGVSTRCIVDK